MRMATIRPMAMKEMTRRGFSGRGQLGWDDDSASAITLQTMLVITAKFRV